MNRQKSFLREAIRQIISACDITGGETRQKGAEKILHGHCGEMRILFMVRCFVQNAVTGVTGEGGN